MSKIHRLVYQKIVLNHIEIVIVCFVESVIMILKVIV